MKIHTRINKLLTVLLLLCVLFVCMAGTAMAEGDVASVTINGETTYYTSIKDAVAKANESGNATITLLQDTTTKERLDITNSATLDLNGNTLSCATYFADDYETMVAITTNNTKLTIIDSVGGGKLDGTGTDYALMLGEPGAYTARSASAYIDGSTVSGSVKTVSGTSMTVSGSTVESNSVVATIDMTNETTLNVFNSQILNTHSSSTASAIDNSGTLTITDSTVSGSIGVDNRGTANISGNTNITSTVCSVKSWEESQDSTLTITGGSYTGGIDISGGTATISGGSYTGGIVVSGGTATISDGTITESRSNKENAVEVSGSADLTISGGTFSATAGGTWDTGVYVHDGGTVKIIGGTITSTAYGVYNDGGSATITGGSISGGTVDLQVVGSDSILNLTLDEGKTVGATFPGGITAEGITLAELLATETATYWGVVDGKDTMLTVAEDATSITDKGNITIRAICTHPEDSITATDNGNGTHTPVCSVCNWTGEATEHTGGTATCQDPAVCEACGVSYGDLDANIHTPTEGTIFTDNGNGTHSYTCACGTAVAEVPHTLDVTTGKCVCGTDMTAIATVTDGTNTYYAADAATLNQAVTAILETGSRTFTVELPADAEAGMITAIRRAICDTEGVADGSIHLTLKGVTSIPGTTNWDGVAFGPGDIYDEAGEIVDQELVTQLASINLPDVTEIGAQAFYFCENLVSVSAPKAQTIGAQAFGYTALTSVEFPELTTIPTDMFSGTWTLSSAKFPKVTTIEQGGLLVGGKFTPENNPTPFPLELTAEGDITFNGSYHFNIAERNYTGKVDLVLCCDKKDAVTFHDDGTATWQVREDLSYTFKSITFKHSYVDGKCTACGEDCDHSGGTATCTTLAVCDDCGASYGAVDITNHDSSVECENGFCPNGCYEPATLNAAGYYEIDNAGKLFWFAQQVNIKGNREIKGVLTADIDLENKPWTPIGETGENNNNFRGVFDGQNYIIRGLNVEGSENGVGFFGEVRTGTVKNFTIFGNVVVNTEVNYVGGVIGSICGVNGETSIEERNGAVIQNITSFVNVTAKAHGIGMIGGFVGYANHQSLIEQCAWYGTFDAGEYRVDSGAGGFIGKIQENTSEVTIRNCGAYGTIKTNYAGDYNNTATIYMGGFLSFSNTNAQTTLENCLFAGRFERGENLTDEARLGAFGTLRSVKAIKNCYYLGDDGLAAVHSDSDLKPGSDNVEITSVTGEDLRGEMRVVWHMLGEYWTQGIHYPILKEGQTWHGDSATYTYTDNGDGTHKKTCNECGYVEEVNEEHYVDPTTTYTDNGNGTHSFKCAKCDAVMDSEPHTIENHVCTDCGAMEIVVSFDAGDFEWKTGDKLYFCRVSRENEWEEYCFTATVAEDGTVTWTPDKTLCWDGTGEHRLIVSYPCTAVGWDDFMIPADQSEVEKLKEADCMNARWVGTPTTNVINFELKHRMAKVTVNYEVAEDVTTEISKFEVYSNAKYCIFSDADGLPINTSVGQYDVWVTPYHTGDQFTAFVSPDAYAADGNFIKITLSDGSVREVKMNKAVTFEEGAEYTYTVVITADGAYLTCADECSFEYTANEDGLTHSKTCSKCGYVAASENHTLTYTTNGSTITESCSVNCGYSASLTLKAPANLVFDRTEKAATVEGEIIADYKLTYSADAVIMAGDYTATLTVGDYSVSLAFTIAKADPDVDTPTGLTATYGQILADVELPGGWAWKNSSASVGSVGSNTFAAIYTPANISNFNTLERDLTVVVAKAMPTVTAPVAADDLVYNGTEQALITAGTATGGTMQYSLDGSNWSETIPTGKDAKTYTVYYKVVGDSNHNDSSVDSVQVTIGKATLTVTADSKTMTTGQELPTFTYTIIGFVGGESEDVLTAKPTVSCEANGQTAGTYDITVSGAAADNYEITHVNGALSVVDHQHAWTYTAKDDTITVTCNAEGCPDAEQSITISAVGKTYDGTPVTATLTGSIDGVATPEITYTSNTNAGTHTASITIEGETASVKFTIEKATVTVTADAKSKPYGTDNPTLTYTSEGLLGDDVLTGALETIATKTSNVGEYDITVGSLANSNYTIDFVGAKLTITKADSSCTAPVAVSGLTFNGGNQSLITAGTATGGTMQYSLDNVTWSETIPTGKDAKTYTVYYKVVGDGNHIGTEPISLDVTITPKAVTELTFEGLNEVYAHTGEAIIPTFVVKDGETTLTEGTDYTADITNNTDVGTATITITLTGNYSGTVTKTFEIKTHVHEWNYSVSGDTITATCTSTIGTCSDAEQSITLNAPDAVYSGNPVEAEVTRDGADLTYTLSYTGADYDSADAPANAGDYTVTMTVGDKSVSATFTISPKDISVVQSIQFSLAQTSFVYSGEAPALNVTGVDSSVGNYTMQEGTDYSVGIVQVNAGSHKLTVTGKGNYTGSVELDYSIAAKPITITDAVVENVTFDPAGYTLTVKEVVFDGVIEGETLVMGENGDYAAVAELTSENAASDAATANVTVSLMNANYSLSEATVEATFQITQSGTEMTAAADKTSYTYGETITVTGTVKATGTAPATTLTLRSAPAAQQVALFAADGTQLTDPVNVVDGAYTLTYNTADKGILPAASITLTVKFVGDEDMADAAANVSIALTEKQLTATEATATTRAYEPDNTTVSVTAVTISGVIGTDDVKVDATNLTGEISSSDAGTYTSVKLADLTLIGSDKAFYTISDAAVTTSVEITPKEITSPSIVLDASSFVYDGTEKKPAVTSVKDGDDLIDATEYTVSYANNIEMGTATVTLTDVAGGNYTVSGSTTFQITQSGTEMTAAADKNSYTYGDTITVSGTIKATGTAPAATLTLRSAPAAQQVALFAADGTQLTEPVNVVDGAYTLTYNTADKGILPAEAITLTVKFVGDADMADATANVIIALTEKQLTATEATTTTRAYEPDNTTVSVTAVAISGVIGTDDVKVDATNLTGEIASADAGTYTSVALSGMTLSGSDKVFYTITDATVTTDVEITPKEITNPTIVLDASSFVYDGTEKKPSVTSVKDGDDLIDATEYTVSYANNIEMGTATVTLTDVAGGNYTVSGSTTFQITQSGTAMTATADKTSYAYGETITVTGTIKATGTAPAATLTLRSAPAAQQVALFAADGTQLTDPVNVVEGAYTLTYNTADKGILPAASITLTVKFVGDDNMADQSAAVTVALTAKRVEPVLSGSASKVYDGTTTVTDASNLTISLNGVIAGDNVSAAAAGYVYADETVGQSKTVTANGITLSGADSIFYTLAQTEASAQIGEIKKAMLIGLTEPADTTLDVYCADADAVIGKLPDTVVYHLADGKTVDLKVEWSCTAYDSTPGATNTFAWAINDSEKLACYEIAQNVADDGTVIVTNSAFLPVTVTGTDTAITYNGTAYDVTQMFAIDSNAGAAVFEIIGGGTGEGTLNGNVLTITKAGTITIKVTTAPNAAYAAGEATAVLTISKGTPAVTLPTDLTAWYGQKLSDIVLPTVDGGAWSWTDMNSTVGNSGVQTHQAIFTPADTNLWNITTHPVNITVVQAGTSFGEMKVYNGNAETTTFTYGETITVKAEATAVQPAAFSLRSLIAPAKHQMALFIRNADGSEVQISEAVNEQNGVYTMTYNTTGKALSIGDNALIAKFVGDENMADYQETVLVTLNPKELTIASLTAQDRVYEPGNQQVAITGTEVSGKADANDDVSVLIDGMTATISSENVGTYDTAIIPQDVSLTGNHAGYYFARGNVAVSIPQGVEITQATPYTASGAPAQPVFDPIYQDGQTLGDIPVSLPAGTFNVPGTIEWEAPGDTPVTEGTPFTWVFTPDDPNWKPVSGTVVIYPDGEPPVITAPAGDQEVTVYEGEQGTMFITAADATSYQWYINRYDGLGYVPISGATSASYTTSVVNLGNDGFTYYCAASNAYGDTESPVFLLQVLEKIEVPETGDESNIALWTALAILSFAGLTIITMNGRRSKITR